MHRTHTVTLTHCNMMHGTHNVKLVKHDLKDMEESLCSLSSCTSSRWTEKNNEQLGLTALKNAVWTSELASTGKDWNPPDRDVPFRTFNTAACPAHRNPLRWTVSTIPHVTQKSQGDGFVGPGFESRYRQRDFLFSINVKTSSVDHPASNSVGTGIVSIRQSGRSVKLTTRFHLVTWLRMSGAIPVLPVYASVTQTGTTSPYLPSRYVTYAHL